MKTNKTVWTGRIVSGLVVAFLALDAAVKLAQPPDAMKPALELGFSAATIAALGAIQLVCLALYLVPRTATLGAVLWTGYLGGAIATHVRVGGPAFSLVFPLVVAALLWLGLYLRDGRVRQIIARPLPA